MRLVVTLVAGVMLNLYLKGQMKKSNAMNYPKVYYGLHMSEGVAFYSSSDEMVLVRNEVISKMNKTFQGKFVFDYHPEDLVDPSWEDKSAGVVVESFFNKYDGNHWCKFIVTSDEVNALIDKGYTLSNSYIISERGDGGTYQGVEYNYEVLDGEFEHLAVVNDPRYAQSKILTPEEFREYNLQKEKEYKLSNSKGNEMKLSFFKKTEVKKLENEKDISEMSVVLPKSKKEKTINELVAEADEKAMNQEVGVEVKMEDYVMVEGEKVTIAELIAKIDELAKSEDEDEVEVVVENMDDKEDKTENMDDKEKDKKANTKGAESSYFKSLKNADKTKLVNENVQTVEIHLDGSALGKKLY